MSWIIDCPSCEKQWFSSDEEIETLGSCPFCEKDLSKENYSPRRVSESRLDNRSDANGCQVYLRSKSLFDWIKKPAIQVYDMFDLSEGGAGIFLSEHSGIDPDQSEGRQEVIIEGIFLDIPEQKKRVITGPIKVPAEVRWVTGAGGDGRAGLSFVEGETEGRDTIAEIIRILREEVVRESGESGEGDQPTDDTESTDGESAEDNPDATS